MAAHNHKSGRRVLLHSLKAKGHPNVVSFVVVPLVQGQEKLQVVLDPLAILEKRKFLFATKFQPRNAPEVVETKIFPVTMMICTTADLPAHRADDGV